MKTIKSQNSLVEEYNNYRLSTPDKRELFEMLDCLRKTSAKSSWDDLTTDCQEGILQGWLAIIQKYPRRR